MTSFDKHFDMKQPLEIEKIKVSFEQATELKFSEKRFWQSLKNFYETELLQSNAELYRYFKTYPYRELTKKEINKKEGREEEDKKENNLALQFISATTLGRILGLRNQNVTEELRIKTEELIDVYLDKCSKQKQTTSAGESQFQNNIFSTDTENIIANRASFLCSSPGCFCLTRGPIPGAPNEYFNIGRASYIHGPKYGYPRYTPAYPKEKIFTAENGIWFCYYHWSYITADEGKTYNATMLNDWKQHHENILKKWVEGRGTIGLGFHLGNETEICNQIIEFTDKLEGLFTPAPQIAYQLAVETITHLKDYMSGIVVPGSEIENFTGSITNVCTYFLDTANAEDDDNNWRNVYANAQKAIGLSFAALAKEFDLELTENTLSITPY